MRRCALFLLLLTLLLGLEAKARESRPNVLFIIADQWRAQTFGFAGDPNVKTPNLDALAHESVNFTNAIATIPVCCPTRASLLTGQRALTHGVFMNDVPLATDAVTFAKVLKAEGYDTGYVGKWHLNGDGRSAFIPRERRQGFDYWKVLECTHTYNNSFYYGDTPQKLKWPGYDAIAQTRDAQEYLRSRTTNDRPFLFMLSWGPPHSPYATAPQKYRELYDTRTIVLRDNVPTNAIKRTRADLAGYYAHCTALDDCVGDLMRTLRETGLDKNTIVIFTSDHGDMVGSHAMYDKQKPYDESIRIPLLIHWLKGFGTTGCRLEAPISSEDIMPTLLGLCKAPVPKTVEGTDFSRYIHGGANPSDNAALIACVAPFADWSHRYGGREFRGLRTTRYTYVRDLNGPWLLFDNEKDPLQMTNLVNQSECAVWQARLEKLLQHKLDQDHDKFLPARDYIKQWGYKVDRWGTVPFEN